MAQRQHISCDNERAQPPDAIAMLRADHQRVRDLFHQYQAESDPRVQRALAEAACTELDIHTQLEEQIFYAAVGDETSRTGEELVQVAIEDHQHIKHLMAALRAIGPDNQAFDATFTELVQTVEHHVEAEESAMFPLAEQELTDNMEDLMTEMQELKEAIVASRLGGR